MASIAEILQKIEVLAKQAREQATSTSSISSKAYECSICQDTEWVLSQDGLSASECKCVIKKRMLARIRNAMIPSEFENAEFSTYKTGNPMQKLMFDSIRNYLDHFEEIRNEPQNSFGFIAKFGEQRLKEIKKTQDRSNAKMLHNNFGLGKTHLQVAAAKELLNRGYTVVILSDVSFMDDLSKARVNDDESEEFNRMLSTVTKADVLIWDDLGKAKPSEFRISMYYRIIDDRYRNKKPILFSTNEDSETLAERIGDATASRLFGMSRRFTFAVEGQDYRMSGA